tara:strand:- start:200 stop:583 length:384 start_codon:yes stop_codon:yes gene_type:complete
MKPTNIKKVDKLMADDKAAQVKIRSFGKILNEMKDIEQQKIYLWTEIYNNAAHDRATASALLAQCFSALGPTAAEHMSLGPTLVKYLERMGKANDQLLALSQVVAKEIAAQSTLNSDDLFAAIEGKQ